MKLLQMIDTRLDNLAKVHAIGEDILVSFSDRARKIHTVTMGSADTLRFVDFINNTLGLNIFDITGKDTNEDYYPLIMNVIDTK